MTNAASDPARNWMEWTEISTKWEDWTADYQASAKPERDGMLMQGVALAKERRAAMLELIQSDPQAALAEAMPRVERERLPREIQQQLETIVSARAPLDLIVTCFHPDQPEKRAHEHEEYHSTFIDNQEYRVHVYGSRLNDLSIPHTSMHGIAIDNQLALSESRVRVLDADEIQLAGISLPTPDAIAVEANGEMSMLPSIDSLAEFEAAILDGEDNPTYFANDAGDGTSTITRRPNEANATGDKKLLLMLVDYSDLPGRPRNRSAGNAPLTEEMANDLIYGPNGVRDFFVESSFGKTDIIMAPPVDGNYPDITEVLRMPEPASFYANTGGSGTLLAHARAAATAAGYNLNDYDRHCLFTSNLANFDGGTLFNGWAGRAAVGGVASTYNGFWDFRVVAHELGHNWGLRHANLWKVTDGNPGSLEGTSQPYGDDFDTMGAAAGSHLKHFSPWNKSLLWWIPDAAIPAAQTDGIYRVHRFDHPDADLSLTRALKIVRDDTRDYWIGYRRADPNTNFYNGAYVLWGYNDGRSEGDLLDMNTPGSNINDAALNMNQTYTDLQGGIEFTPVAQGGSGGDEWIEIQVVFPEYLVEFSTPTLSVNYDAGIASLVVNRTPNSFGSASVNYATSPGTATAPGDYTTTSGTLTWADDDLESKIIEVPINPDGPGNQPEKNFTVTLSSPVDTKLGAIADATVTITYIEPPFVYAGPDQTLTFDSAPSSPGTSATLAGTASDPGGNPLTTIWSVFSGPAEGAVIANPSSLTPDVTFTQPGSYVLRLTVSNGFSTVTSDVIFNIESGVSYTLTYNSNGSESGSAPPAQAQDSAIDLILATNTGNLTKTGFTFIGWNTAADGTGTSYAEAAAFSLNEDTTLYADWNHIPAASAGANQTLVFNETTWSPMELGTPLAWYDAADASSITGANGAVSQWNDKSGNNRHIAQTTLSRRPIHGNDTINFNGTSHYLWRNDPFLFANGQADVFIVGSIPAQGDRRIIAEASSLSNNQIYGIAQSNTTASRMGTFIRNNANAATPGHVALSPDGALNNTRKIYQWRDTGSSLSGRVNSIAHETTFYARTGNYSFNRFSVGALLRSSPGNFAQGGINEILLSNNLPDQDREKIEGYLAHKWGLATNLPTAHPYKDKAPASPGAAGTLAGIASDLDGDALTTTWSVHSGPAGGASIEDPSSLTSGVFFFEMGTYVLRLTVSDGFATVTRDVTITIGDLSIYQNWVATNGLDGDDALPGTILRSDGLTNLQKFAFGLDPAIATFGPVEFSVGGQIIAAGSPTLMNSAPPAQPDAMQAIFTRHKNHTSAGLSYIVEFSADLKMWTASSQIPTVVTQEEVPGDYEVVSIPFSGTVPVHGGGDEQPPTFMRITVSMD